MKRPSLKTGIIAAVSIVTVLGVAGVYALTDTPKAAIDKVITEAPTNNKVETVITEPQEAITAPEPQQEPEPTPVAEPEPTASAAPVVRSYDEIIRDYPNMSSIPGLIECSGYIAREWPEYFKDHNREENVKRIATRFTSSCAAIEGRTARHEQTILAHHLTNYGVQ